MMNLHCMNKINHKFRMNIKFFSRYKMYLDEKKNDHHHQDNCEKNIKFFFCNEKNG